jgi:hypothetical protein
MNDTCYWAITGRLPGDDEDCPYVSLGAMNQAQAEDDFKAFMVETALENESESDLRERLGLDADAVLVDHVYITSVLRSTAQIEHA